MYLTTLFIHPIARPWLASYPTSPAVSPSLPHIDQTVLKATLVVGSTSQEDDTNQSQSTIPRPPGIRKYHPSPTTHTIPSHSSTNSQLFSVISQPWIASSQLVHGCCCGSSMAKFTNSISLVRYLPRFSPSSLLSRQNLTHHHFYRAHH